MNTKGKQVLLFVLLLTVVSGLRGQGFQNHLHVQNCTTGRSWTAADLVQNILIGQGVQVSNVQFNGSTGVIGCNAIGTFYTDTGAATTEIGLREGILITTGSITGAPGPNSSARISSPYSCNTYTDTSLQAIAGLDQNGNPYQLYNTSVLEFDFVPQTDSVGFRYVFASEEYPEYVGAPYNDIFAFFVSGPKPGGGSYQDTNIAIVPGTGDPVRIATVNEYINPQYYIDNYGTPFATAFRANRQVEYDGLTTVLTAYVHVIPCSTYHMRISLSDVNDSTFDSGVFLEAGSLSAKSIEISFRTPDRSETSSHDIVETCCLDMVVKLLNPNSTRRILQMYRTHNSGYFNASGNDYTITCSNPQANITSTNPNSPSTVTFPEGVDSLILHICGNADNLVEGTEHFRLAYRLIGDCDYLVDTFNIVDVGHITINSPMPDNTSDSGTVDLNAFNGGGVPPFTYMWIDEFSHDTTYTHGSGTWSSITVPLEPLRQYTICITDACGSTECTTTAVGPTPIFIDTSAYYDTVCYNTTTTLTCSGGTSYRWYQGTNTTGYIYSTAPSYTTPSITYNREFTVVASRDTLGATWTNTRHYYIAYEALPSLTLTHVERNSSASTTYACNGDSVHLAVGSSEDVVYRWNNTGTFGIDSTYALMPNQASSTANYATTTVSVTARSANRRQCENSRNITIRTFAYPTLTAVPDIEICTTQTFVLHANPQTATGVQYWYSIPATGYTHGRSNTGYWSGLSTPTSRDYVIHAASGVSTFSCAVSDTVHVDVHPLPLVTATASPAAACSGEPVTLTGYGASTYVWKRGSATIGNSQNTVVTNSNSNANTASNITYQLQGTDSQGCSNSASVTVQVHSIPNVNLTVTPNPVCEGGSVTLRATGARFVSWDSTLWTNSTPFTHTQQLNTVGNNTLYAWGYNTLARCNSRSQTTVNVLAYPAVHVMADADSVCAGSSTTLHLSGAYEYSLDDTLHYSTSTTRIVTPTGTGTTYTIYGRTSAHICISSTTIRIGVLPLPTVTLTATDTNLCQGQTATLTATGGNSFNWHAGNSPLSEHGNSITVSPSSTTIYTVEGVTTGYTPCSTTRSIRVNVFDYPALTAMADTGVCTGSSMLLHANPRTATGVAYWYTILGAGDTALGMGSEARWTVMPTDTCDYIIHAATGPGHRCHLTDTVHVDRYPLPVVATQALPSIICSGDTAILTSSGASQYTWQHNGTVLPHQAGDTAWVSPTNEYVDSLTVVYTLVATDSNGCQISATQSIHVLPLPLIEITPSASFICQGDSVTLTADIIGMGGASGFQWYRQGVDTPLVGDSGGVQRFAPDSTITYRVTGITEGAVRCRNSGLITIHVFQRPTLTVMGDTVLCRRQTLHLHAGATSITPPVVYTYHGDGNHGTETRDNGSSQVAWDIVTGSVDTVEYVLSASTGPDSLCRVYDTVHVLVRPLPDVVLTASRYELCDGDTMTLVGSGAVSYSFSDSSHFSIIDTQQSTPPIGAHSYILHGEDQYGCRNSDTTTVTVYGYPTTQLVSNIYDICHGSTIALTASGAQHYSWDGGNSWRNAQAGSMIDTMTRILYDSITLYVEGYNLSSLCQVRDSVRIRVYSYPVMNWMADTNQICLNDTVHLTASGAVEYSYDGGSNWTSTSRVHYVPTTPTTHNYSVIGRSEGPGCQTPTSINVQVHPLPNLQLNVSNSAFCVDTIITISATGGERYRLYDDTTTVIPDYGFASQWSRQPDSSTIYTVDCLTQYNCFATIQHSVEVWTGRFQLFCEDTIVCEHGHVAVSAQGMHYYYWNGDTIPDTHNVYIFTVDSSSDFTVLGTDAHGCWGEETMHVDVYPNPHLQLSADTLGVCSGGTVNILASGAGEYIYHWQQPILPGTNPLTTTDSSCMATVVDTTWFTVTGIEGNLRCQTTDSIQIVAYPLPHVQLTGDRRDICDRDTLTLIASGADRYDWNPPFSTFNAPFTITDVPTGDSIYLVWGEEDTYHCRNYDTTRVNWFAHPPVALLADHTKICEGDSAVLFFSGAPYYDWNNSGSLTTNNTVVVHPDTTTVYYLHSDLRNPRFCGSDTSLTIEVFPIPAVHVTASDTEICYGDTIIFFGNGATYYSWQGQNTPAGAFDTTHYAIDTLRTPLYRSATMILSGTIPNRLCYNRDSIHITVYDPRVRLNPQAWEICNGGSLVISATGSDRYRWTDDGTFTDSTSHTYTFNGNGTTSSQTFIHVAGESANHLCQADTTITIVVYPGPNIHLTIEDVDSIAPRTWEICAGDSVMFFATGGYYYQFPGQSEAARPVRHRYHPLPTGPDTSTYILYGENFNHQCSGYDSLTIIVNPLPNVALDASRSEVCMGDTVTFTGSGATQYAWFGNMSFSTLTTQVVTVDQPTQYLLWGKDMKGCRNFDTITVNALPIPVVHLTASADTICQGFSTTLTATGGVQYAWGITPLYYDSLNTQVITPLHDTVVYVWGNNYNGLCASMDSILITVLPVPSVQIVADNAALCWGDTAQLTAVCSENTWAWREGTGAWGPFVNTPWVISPQDSTWYYIATQSANGCYAYDSLLVEVHPFYHVHLNGDTNVCQGDSLLITATGSNLYAWGNSTSFSSISWRYVTPHSDTLIVVHGTARDSVCRTTDTLPIHVHARPNLYVDPETTTVCLGDSIIISASGCEQYRWMEDSEFGLHNGYHVYRPQTSMTYIVTGSMPGGVCIVTAPIEMTVIDTPLVQFTGARDICLGDSVRLTASGGTEYAWDNSTTFSTSGYHNDMPTTLGSHTYQVAARVHSLHCTGRASVAVEVHPVPVLTLSVDDSILCYGDEATLTASGAYQYSWNIFGIPLTGNYTTDSHYVVIPPITTQYLVYATDSMMLCADTQSITITVNALPIVTLTADTTEICIGDNVLLRASGGQVGYSWNDTYPYTTQDSLILTPQQDGIVRLQGIDSNGCINRDSVLISLHSPFQPYTHDDHHVAVHVYPSVTAAIDHGQICLGDSVTLTASGAQQYRWINMGDSPLNPIGDRPSASRTYIVEGQMAYGCPDSDTVSVQVFLYPPVSVSANASELCVGDTLWLTASGASRYSWDDGSYATDSGYWVVPSVGSHTYLLRGATDNLLCASTDTARVTVYPYPDMTLRGAVRWCEGSEVVLVVDHPADTLRWTSIPPDASLAGQEHEDTLRLHPSVSTLYQLHGTSHNCSVDLKHPVEIVPYPRLRLTATDDRICIGDSVLLTASGGELYAWNGSLTGYNQYTVTDTVYYRPSITGIYPVVATTYDTLCSVIDSVYIWVDTVPLLSIEGSDSGCIGRTTTLIAHSDVPILWTATPYDASLDTQSSMFTVVVSPREETLYKIEGYSGRCYGWAQHVVRTGIIPKAGGIALPMRVRRGEADIELVNRSHDEEGFYWVFPDSSRRFGDHYTYQIAPSWMGDTFPVHIVAYRGGCSDTAHIPIVLYNDEQWASNVFSPNEETNNRFFVPLLNKDDFHVEIFNRRGLKVYESDNPDEGWDGRSRGVLCPQATYVYRVRTSPKGSSEIKYVYGTVTLLR